MFHVRALAGLVAATLALAVAPAAAMAAPHTPRYRMVDLGTLGGASSYALAGNDRGAVIGRSEVSADVWHAFVWQDGTMTDLGGTFWPNDINNRGQIVGSRDDAPGGWVWSDGRFTPAGALTSAKVINDRGEVLGQGLRTRTVPTGPRCGLTAELGMFRWTTSPTSTTGARWPAARW